VIALARDLPMLWCAASPSWRVPYFVIRLGAIGSLAGKVSSMVINQLLLTLVQVLARNPITRRVLDSQIRVDPSRIAFVMAASGVASRHAHPRCRKATPSEYVGKNPWSLLSVAISK